MCSVVWSDNIIHGHSYTNAAAVTRSTLLDLFLLAEADALVAGFGSHFG